MYNVTRPHLNNRFQAAMVRGHLRMHIAGMRHSKISATKILQAASEITGVKYKRGQYQAALDDIQALLERDDV